jgi:ABC-type phosphate transport system substrate-binding protein
MLKTTKSSFLRQGLLTASVATSLFGTPIAGQAFPVFPQLETVNKGTSVRLQGSTSTSAVVQSLKQGFDKKYPGSQVKVTTAGSKAAIANVVGGSADVAVIGRPLTPGEKAQGLVEVPMGREKIAIVVGQKNPYTKDLTIGNFARIFRGEISNWSAIGGPKGVVQLVDRPESDTRQAFPNYPAFQNGKFVPAANAVKVTDESPKAMAERLGTTGVSFMPISAVENVPGVRVLTMHKVSPTDKRYPFSHPLYYIYKGAQPNDAVKAFLGFAGTSVGQTAMNQAGLVSVSDFNKEAEGAGTKIAAKPAEAPKTEAGASPKNPADPAQANALKAGEGSHAAAGHAGAKGEVAKGDKIANASANQIAAGNENGGVPGWVAWILLPIGLLGLLLWLLPNDEEENKISSSKRPKPGDDNRRTTLGGVVDRTKDTVGGIAGKTTDAVGNVAETGIGAIGAGAAAATGAGAAAWARLKGERDGNRDDWDETDGASDGITPEFSVEGNPEFNVATPDWNLADVAGDVKDGAGNVVEGSKNRAFDLGTGAIAGGAAAAAGLAAAGWNAVKSTGDTKSDEGATWEFKEEEEGDRITRIGDYASNKAEGFKTGASNLASGAGDAARTGFGKAKDGANRLADGTENAAGGFMSKLKKAASTIVGDAGSAATKAKDFAGDVGGGAMNAAGNLKDGAGNVVAGGAAAVAGAAAGAFLGGDRNNIILVPYNSREALVRWEVDQKDLETIQSRGGNQLVLRLYDVTEQQDPPTFQQFDLDEKIREQRIMIPQRNRTYVTALGYLTRSGNFLEMARSESVRIPAV